MGIRRILKLILLSLMPLLLSALGCSGTASLMRKALPQSWADKILSERPNLKKRVMVFPLVDQAGLGRDMAQQYDQQFYRLLKGCPRLLVSEPPDGMFSSLSMESPQYGVVTNSRLVDFAQSLGMNNLIIGVLNPPETCIRKTGIWPFDDWKKIYTISMAVNVVDTASKTLLMSHLESKETAIALEEAEEMDEKAFMDEVFAESYPEIIRKQVETVGRELRRQPWTGTTLAVEDDVIMINAGREVGLEPGKLFEVFALGESILSESGRTIYLFGEKIGMIKVNLVMETHALAKPLTGGPFKPKQFVRFKP